mmetsp:Transcript_12133/g.28769  ORF Transcript_12133/g.28769 Transcript_12133/m.28769 type:complete len:99 (+) Transcript_12133:1383-1679(+)
MRLPKMAALFLEKPNHISFLSERSNSALMRTLGFLLPIARLLRLGVLDFDKYYATRDSVETAAAVLPIVEGFLFQELCEDAREHCQGGCEGVKHGLTT